MLRFDDRLAALDLTLFESIDSETTSEDKRSLLALQVACRREFESFNWLEIGSHLGGSLQTLVRDPRCAYISSIDPRPTEQLPDERQRQTSYPDNSTKRMLELLGRVPGARLGIVRTYEASTETLDPDTFDPPHVCFVDGEHTDEACERDADFCRRALRNTGLIAFHDVQVVYGGIAAFLERLKSDGVPHRAAYLPDRIFAVELGDPKLLEDPAVVSRRLAAGSGVLAILDENDRYRAFLKARRARVLQTLRILPRRY
jgi:Methyltransferase domain